MKRFYVYIAVLVFILFISASQNTFNVYAQKSELIDARTGKPVDRKTLSRFLITGRAVGIIPQTSLKFYSSLIETNDEQKVTRNIYYSDNKADIKKYFKTYLSEPRKILTREKIKKKDSTIVERIVSEITGKNEKHYEIVVYAGEKSFVAIVAEKLDLAVEVEKWLNTQK